MTEAFKAVTAPIPADKQGKRERTYCSLVTAAITLIAAKGPEAISIDELVKAAGVARGTFYNYFQSLEEVVETVGKRIKASFRETVEQHLPHEVSAEVIVLCHLYGCIRFALSRPAMGWVMVRLGGGVRAILDERLNAGLYPVSDPALQALFGKRLPHLLTLTYLEGSLLLVLRRLLEGLITLHDAEQIFCLILRGAEIPEERIQDALMQARLFAETLDMPAAP